MEPMIFSLEDQMFELKMKEDDKYELIYFQKLLLEEFRDEL